MRHALHEAPHFTLTRPEPGKRASWVLAVLMHVLLAAFLIYGVSWQTKSPEVAVSVDLVRYAPPVSAQSKRAAPPEPQPQPKPEPLPPKVEVKEPPAPPKAQILRKEPEKKPKPEKPAPPVEKYDPIKKALEQASKNQKDADARMNDAAARAQTQFKAGQAAQAAAARNKGLADYLAKVRGKVRGNIVLPPGIDGNPEIELLVTQLPSGEVLSVKFKTRSGNAALDTAVERAIYKSSPLPKPDDPSLFERELSIKYRPLED